jgi:hypothetical protein
MEKVDTFQVAVSKQNEMISKTLHFVMKRKGAEAW